MKERLEVIDFKYKVVIATFLFFFIICTLCPISGEDWANYLIGKEGFLSCVENVNILDGRIISGFLASFLSYNKVLFNISFALLMSAFVYACNYMLGYVKNKIFYLLPFIGTLLVSTICFSRNYVSVTSCVSYTFPAILSFLYFFRIFRREDYNFSFREHLILILISLVIILSSIHIAIVFLLANIIFYLYTLVNKKKCSSTYLLIILLDVILLSISLMSLRTNLFYNDFSGYLERTTKYITNVFSRNIILILLGAIPINYYLNDLFKDFLYKRVIITLFDLILVFSLAYNFTYYSPVNIALIIDRYFGVFAVENWYYIFFFAAYMILFFLSILKYIGNRRTKVFFKLFSILCLIFSLFIYSSPMWNEGENIFVIIFLVASISLLLKELDIILLPKITSILTIFLIGYYLSIFGMTKYIDVKRNDYIEEQLEVNTNIIEVKANPFFLLYRYNPKEIYQQKDFKEYYEIPKDKEIVVRYFGIFEKIEKKVKE